MVIFAVESFGFFVRADRMKLSSARTVTTGGAVDNVAMSAVSATLHVTIILEAGGAGDDVDVSSAEIALVGG
jgi:hypothetical protein